MSYPKQTEYAFDLQAIETHRRARPSLIPYEAWLSQTLENQYELIAEVERLRKIIQVMAKLAEMMEGDPALPRFYKKQVEAFKLFKP